MPFFQFLLFCLFLLQMISAKASVSWPAEIISTLSKWQEITSITYDDSSKEITSVVVKRWRINHSSDGDVLIEKIPLSLKTNFKNSSDPSQGGSFDWIFTFVKLSESISLEPFVRNARSGSQSNKTIQNNEHKIIIDFNERKFKLILLRTMGEPDNKFLFNSSTINGFNTTPNGSDFMADAYMKALFGIDVKPFSGPRYLLNHDVHGGSRKVLVSLEFPEVYIKILQEVIDEWNKLFARSYYVLGGKQILNPVDCISEQILCIKWTGGDRFTWTGFHGSTELAADPGTGKVIGGIIYLYNDAYKTYPREGTSEELALVENPGNLREAALGFSQITKYSQIWRRDSSSLVKWLLLHEMGHFFGWHHNFSATWSDQSGFEAATVMGYPPFNLVSKFNHLGPIDHARFQMVYNKKAIIKKEIPFCGELEINPYYDGKKWSKKVPECLIWSAGASDWLYLNAQNLNPWQTVLGWGVYQALTPKKNELGSFIATLGFIAKGSHSAVERSKAINYLCSMSVNDPKILPFILQHLGLEIKCR